MAKECVLVLETQPPISMPCAADVTIEKGAVLMMADGMVAATATGDTDIVAGICAVEKLANSNTKVSVYRGGLFRGYAGAAGVTVGCGLITDVGTGAANEIVKADVNSENLLGTSFETKADGAQFLFELKPMGINLA